jgi:hypothetical protein
MPTAKLNQIVAVEKGEKSRHEADTTVLLRTAQKAVLFSGLSRVYQPHNEDDVKLPPEHKSIAVNVTEVLKGARESWGSLFDVVGSKDWGNALASATVRSPEGEMLLENAPPTFLITLEKELVRLRTLVAALPTLDSSLRWHYDAEQGFHRSAPVPSLRTQKKQKAIVMYDATPEHPAQTQLITEDVPVGEWTTEATSGAISMTERDRYLSRIDALIKATKFAREEANSLEIERKVDLGKELLDYIFK